MKRFLILILVSISFSAFAQTNLDSLWGVWKNKTLDDSSRLGAINQIVRINYYDLEYDSAFTYAEIQVLNAREWAQPIWLARGHRWKGAISNKRSEWQQAIQHFENAKESYLSAGDVEQAAKMLNLIGIRYKNIGEYVKSIQSYEASKLLYQEVGNKEMISACWYNIARVYQKLGSLDRSIENHLKSLKIEEEIGNHRGIATSLNSIGSVYYDMHDEDAAEAYWVKSKGIYEELTDTIGIANALNNIGTIKKDQGKYDEALVLQKQSLELKIKTNYKEQLPSSYGNIGLIYLALERYTEAEEFLSTAFDLYSHNNKPADVSYMLNRLSGLHRITGDYAKSIELGQKSLSIAKEISNAKQTSMSAYNLYLAYKATNAFEKSLQAFELFKLTQDSLLSKEKQRSVLRQEYKYAYEKEALADSLEFAQKEALTVLELEKQETKVRGQRIALGSMGLGLALILALAFSIHRGKKRSDVLRKQSDDLLLNILPAETAKELKQKGHADAKQFDEVTVLFTDFKGFTAVSEKLSATELVAEIDVCFKAFDHIMEKYNIEKIKTIGDAYMAAGGLPVANTTNPADVVKAGIEIRDFMLCRRAEQGEDGFEIRIGIHTGPVVAGIVGIKKFAYDIWGDTVNTASRMESSGEAGKVNISETTYQLVKDQFTCDYRGEIEAKGKGKVKMYFVERA